MPLVTVLYFQADCGRCQGFPVWIVDVTEFTLTYFRIELWPLLDRQKYHSLQLSYDCISSMFLWCYFLGLFISKENWAKLNDNIFCKKCKVGSEPEVFQEKLKNTCVFIWMGKFCVQFVDKVLLFRRLLSSGLLHRVVS